jgi:putative addiction module component (TIGR02574 family)
MIYRLTIERPRERKKMDDMNDDLLREVLSLPSDQRTFFIDRLIESLNIAQRPEIDALWEAEIDRRVEEIKSGKVKLVDGEEVFSEVRKRLKK